MKTLRNILLTVVIAFTALLPAGVASAASATISNTGPGSTNIIFTKNLNSSKSNIYNTGPDSTNVIISSWNHHKHFYWVNNW